MESPLGIVLDSAKFLNKENKEEMKAQGVFFAPQLKNCNDLAMLIKMETIGSSETDYL